MAQPNENMPERRTALISKVADILDIDQQTLENAFRQAQQEQRGEALDNRLEELVNEGTINQQQANEFNTWINSRPDVPLVGPRQLKKLIQEGKISQEQVDALKAWMESKPDIPKIMPPMGERPVNEGIVTQGQVDQYKGWLQSRPDLPKVGPKNIGKLLREGMITQEQAEGYKSWFENRPEDSQELRPRIRQFRADQLKEHRDALLDRVANILGIDKQKLIDAFEQALQELREQMLDNKIQEFVDNGTITQSQASAYKAWIQSRPDVPRLPMLP
jgi:competence protein ComGC